MHDLAEAIRNLIGLRARCYGCGGWHPIGQPCPS